jgi:Sec-independent protein secretion pathway component TatC
LIILYEIGIIIARFTGPAKKEEKEEEEKKEKCG